MIGALWTGITGLASHQTALDNESHNIANVNTIGFKASRISFADQMYQDRIGKGSKVLDAEKLYVQGNLKLTGVDYDMALSGDGFFTVLNTRSSGSSETLYTRAGNFRMGDNGTLQDAAGNEVQGWAMRPIDPNKDVVTTNQNVNMFTNDYRKLLSSKVVKHETYIETITAKATDYTKTAKADPSSIYSGAGARTKSAKTKDVEAVVADYSSWLSKLRDNPDGGSASSIAQTSQVNFKSGTDSILSKDGTQIYLYLNGTKYSQNYISGTVTNELRQDLSIKNTTTTTTTINSLAHTISNVAAGSATDRRYEIEIDGKTIAYTATAGDDQNAIATGLRAAATAAGYTVTAASNNIVTITGLKTGFTHYEGTYDTKLVPSLEVAASRIATYKALADQISEVPGFKAYMAEESETKGNDNDILQTSENFTLTTKMQDMIKGIIEIKSLIPGKTFTISEVGEESGQTKIAGSMQTSTAAVMGTGRGALESARDALAKVLTGKQRDVYTRADLGLKDPYSGSLASFDFKYSLSIYDKELKRNISVPGTNGTPPIPYNIFIDNAKTVDEIVDAINKDTYQVVDAAGTVKSDSAYKISDYITAKNINGNLVIEPKGEENYDIEFSGSMSKGDNTAGATGSYLALDKNNDYSGREGAGAEFLELINTVDQTTTQSSLQLRLDSLGISNSAFGEFSVDSAGVIMMKQDGADFAIGQVSIALFNNKRGLEPSGDNLLARTNNSGEPIYNLNNDKTAKVEGKTLELSTADLSESLVNLMVYQRAFEANAKSITTSDQLLNTLINLKR